MAIFSARSPFSSWKDSDSDISMEDSEASDWTHWSDLSGSGLSDVTLDPEEFTTISTCSSRPDENSLEKISGLHGVHHDAHLDSVHRDSTATGGIQGEYFIKNRNTTRRLVKFLRFGSAWGARLRRAGCQLLPYSLNYGLKLLVKKQHRKAFMLRRVQRYEEPQSVEDTVFRLVELPTELILSILDLCDLGSLYTLTATCHLLCSISFPLFVAKSGLILPNPDPALPELNQHAPHGVIDIRTPEEALALLVWKRQRSFHRVTVLNFSLEISVKRVITLVNRSLTFFDSSAAITAPFANVISIYISSFRKVDAQACRLIYGLRNSGCIELSVTGLTSDSILYSYRDTVGMPLKVELTGYERLESFKSCGSFPFLSPLLPFTTRNLINPRLRELYLTVNSFSAGKWAKFLKDLSLRNLVILTIGGSIPLVSVLKFLRRHKKLKWLSLSGIDVCFHPPSLRKGFSIPCPELEFIDAPALYILGILKYLRQANRLSHIAVQTDIYSPTSTADLSNSRRSSVKALFHQLIFFPGITKVEMHLSRSGSLDFCDTSGDGNVPPEKLLSCVNTLILFKSGGRILNNEDLAKILSWISLFPSLSTVELYEKGDDSRHDWKSALCSMNIVPVVQKFP